MPDQQAIEDRAVEHVEDRIDIPGSVILDLIGSGQLSHDTMAKQTVRVQVIGDAATAMARGQNIGKFRGEPIAADEWITDVYRRVEDRWLCVLTHLTPAYQPEQPA